MASFRGSTNGMSPMTTSMFLVGAAAILAGGFYFASGIATGSGGDPPEIGMWSDDANDRLLVVLGDAGTDWHDIEVRTDAPAMVRVGGPADRTHGTPSLPGSDVVLGEAGRHVMGGDALAVCGLQRAGPVEVTLTDRPSRTVVFQQVLDVQACL